MSAALRSIVTHSIAKRRKPLYLLILAICVTIAFITHILDIKTWDGAKQLNEKAGRALNSFNPFFVAEEFSNQLRLCRYVPGTGVDCQPLKITLPPPVPAICRELPPAQQLFDRRCGNISDPLAPPAATFRAPDLLESLWSIVARPLHAAVHVFKKITAQGWLDLVVHGFTLLVAMLLLLVIGAPIFAVIFLTLPAAGIVAAILKFILLILTYILGPVLGFLAWVSGAVASVAWIGKAIKQADELQETVANMQSPSVSAPPTRTGPVANS